jgi:protein-disulfide isomerase
MMKNRIVLPILAGAVAVIQASHCAYAQTSCTVLGRAAKAKLAEYVQKKYKTPQSVHLNVTEVEFVGGTCFRKLQFTAQEAQSSFRLELFASPDLRFLARELIDATTDPVADGSQKAEAFSAGLTRGDFPARGRAGAPVTLTVFSDFECPYSSRFAAIVKELSPEDTAKVRLVFRNLPLSMHPWARPAAEAAACAQEQGNSYFWALHDFIFDHQKELTGDNLLQKLAESARPLSGFDQGKFAACVIERKTAAQIDKDVAFAEQNAINATPTAFLNGQRTQIVAPEQLGTLIRELSEPDQPAAKPARQER